MRLIDVHSGLLVEVQWDSNPPNYTILSHRWCDDEVTFQDVQSAYGNFRNKKGFAKIKFACEQTIKDGMSYTWVDTCCIDKSSSAELTEAINSMYNWYRHSRVCYAYLADVSFADGTDSAWSDFRASEWFTRCWTLQELIAPHLVKFYGKEWEPIGEKISFHAPRAYDVYVGGRSQIVYTEMGSFSPELSKVRFFHQILSEITGIPAPVFNSREMIPGEFSVAQKMSWASTRKCTKVEDRAYSLLGIFNVNLPLLYGEGKKAFARLQEEIIKKVDDHSILAWTVTEDDSRFLKPSDILAESPADFARSSTIVPFNEEVGTLSTMTKRGLSMHLFMQPVKFPETTHIHWFGTRCEAFYAMLNCGDTVTSESYLHPGKTCPRRVALVVILADDPAAPSSSTSKSRQYIRLCTKTHILIGEQEKYEDSSLFRDVYLSRFVPQSLLISLRVKTNLYLRVMPTVSREVATRYPIHFVGLRFCEKPIQISAYDDFICIDFTQFQCGENVQVTSDNNITLFDKVANIQHLGSNFIPSFENSLPVRGNKHLIGLTSQIARIRDSSYDISAVDANQYIYRCDGTFASWSLDDILLRGPQQSVLRVDLGNSLTCDKIVLILAVMKDPGRILCHLCQESDAEDVVTAIKSNTYESAGISFVDLTVGGIASSSMVLAEEWLVSATLNGEHPHLPFPERVPRHWRSIIMTLEVKELQEDIGNNHSFYIYRGSIPDEMDVCSE